MPSFKVTPVHSFNIFNEFMELMGLCDHNEFQMISLPNK